MSDKPKQTLRGIRKHGEAWLAIERDVRGGTVVRERMLDSFSGTGSKAKAIKTAGTNAVLV